MIVLMGWIGIVICNGRRKVTDIMRNSKIKIKINTQVSYRP